MFFARDGVEVLLNDLLSSRESVPATHEGRMLQISSQESRMHQEAGLPPPKSAPLLLDRPKNGQSHSARTLRSVKVAQKVERLARRSEDPAALRENRGPSNGFVDLTYL
jgi:hypothetical protein